MGRRGQYITMGAINSVFFARWWSAAVILLVGGAVICGAAWLLLGRLPLAIPLGVGFVFVIGLQLEQHRQSVAGRRQTESMIALCAAVKSDVPLPLFGGWTVGADFANLLVTLIRHHQPKLIVEAGSGASTVVMGHCLRDLGGGRIVSLEHDAGSYRQSRTSVEHHGLTACVEVAHAPLRDYTIDGRVWSWYDTTALSGLPEIDLLVIDGPPIRTQRMARYPAVPILFDRLSARSVILLDDAARHDEKRVVTAWKARYGKTFECEVIRTAKGAAVLRRLCEEAGRRE